MTGNATIDKALMGLNILISCAAVGLIVFSHTTIKPKPISNSAEFEKLKSQAISQAQVPLIEMKKMTLNLYSPTSRLRYLDVQLSILPFEASQQDLLQKSEALVSDVIVDVAAQMPAEEMGTIAGKILFENRIKKMANQKLGGPVIKKVYFSRFVIQ